MRVQINILYTFLKILVLLMAFNDQRFHMRRIFKRDKILDVRSVLEAEVQSERKGKSLVIDPAIESNELADNDQVIADDEENEVSNDPVLDVISAFFGHDTENTTIDNEKKVKLTKADNDLSFKTTTKNDGDLINDKQDAKTKKSKEKLERLQQRPQTSEGAMKAKLHRNGRVFEVAGGLDFSNAVFNEKLGKLCMEKEEEIESLEKSPILECNHK